jgi:hypothetical protein
VQVRAWYGPILHDFEDDRILSYIGNETRLLSFMSALDVNSGTAPRGGLQRDEMATPDSRDWIVEPSFPAAISRHAAA